MMMFEKNKAWAAITEALNAVSLAARTVAQVLKKGLTTKLLPKKHIAGGGQGPQI